MGYHNAGFEVIGVDIAPQPNYPFEFVQGDAIEYVMKHGSVFDAIHASPPCQSQTALTKGTNKGKVYPDLIPQTQRELGRLSVPTVIENVSGSSIRKDMYLCGEMFGLAVLRHRYFEIDNCEVVAPPHPKHRGRVAGYRHGVWYEGPYFAVYGTGGGKGRLADWQRAMEMPWAKHKWEIAEAIPPAYTEYIGKQLMNYV